MTAIGRDSSPQRNSGLHRWALALGVCAVVAWLAWRWHAGGGFQAREFLRIWTEARWGWLALSAFAYMGAYWARAERWGVMLRPIRPSPGMSGIFSATVIGFAAVMLMGRAGELVRPYLISVQESTALSAQIAVWVLERLFDLLMLLTLFGIALALVAGRAGHDGTALTWIVQTGGVMALAIAALCIALLVALGVWGTSLCDKLRPLLGWLGERKRDRVLHFVDTATHGFTSIRHLSLTIKALGWSVFHWIVVCFCYVAALKAFPATQDRSLADALVLMAFSAFGSIVQVPGIGGGPQVACTMVLVELFRVPLEAAAGIALVIYLVGFLAIVPLGLALIARRGLSLTKLRHLREDVSA